MNPYLKAFSLQMARVIVMTASSVVFVAFTSIPYTLGGHPGEMTAPAP